MLAFSDANEREITGAAVAWSSDVPRVVAVNAARPSDGCRHRDGDRDCHHREVCP